MNLGTDTSETSGESLSEYAIDPGPAARKFLGGTYLSAAYHPTGRAGHHWDAHAAAAL